MNSRTTRRNFLAGTAAALAPGFCGAIAQAAETRPNIVLILADDLGMGDLGCYGQKILKTPNIDRLASEGLRFTEAYAGAAVCAPSRCSLMTGYHMGHATVRGNWEVYPEGQHPLEERDTTVAQMLKASGYATGLCGKWGLGGPESRSAPNKAGFDFFYGYNCQRHAHRFYTDYLWKNTERVSIPQSRNKLVYAQDLIADESLRFIRENRRNPFFLFCAWTLPHGPYDRGQVPSIEAWRQTDWSDTEKVYAAMVERLDSDVGRVTALLEELQLDRNTLVLFASDNGAGAGPVNHARFGGPAGLRGQKGTLYEGGIRAPMIARWPGKVPRGRTTNFPTAFWDFLPTCADLAGTPAPRGLDGISIAPTLFGKSQKPHNSLYWEHWAGGKSSRALRFGNWKAYQDTPTSPIELYDLAKDRSETENLAAAEPKVAARAAKMIVESRVDVTPPPLDPRIWEKYREDNRKLDELLAR